MNLFIIVGTVITAIAIAGIVMGESIKEIIMKSYTIEKMLDEYEWLWFIYYVLCTIFVMLGVAIVLNHITIGVCIVLFIASAIAAVLFRYIWKNGYNNKEYRFFIAAIISGLIAVRLLVRIIILTLEQAQLAWNNMINF